MRSPTSVKKQILVIDDDPEILGLLSRLLGRHFDLIAASSRADIVSLSDRIDLALVDLHVAGESGFDVIEDLRKAHPALPAALLTGAALGAIEYERARALGVSAVIDKPWGTREALIQQIARLI